ncbi:hypothetical protein ACMDCR_26870 [Labrys okinawensis]|uniref:hypothetical protein n=1 Tax=Labrys okinawensis TaxID=346911 RepID=UPI0039BCB946
MKDESVPAVTSGAGWSVAGWLLLIAGVLLILVANAHLVMVSLISQPACVDHVRLGEGTGRTFAAAQSDCTSEGPEQSVKPGGQRE